MKMLFAVALVAVGLAVGVVLGGVITPASAAPADARLADVVAQLKILNSRVGAISVRDNKTVIELLGQMCRVLEGPAGQPTYVC